MRLKTLLLSALLAASPMGVLGAPTAFARPSPVTPNWVIPTQGRDHGDHRGQNVRPLREVVEELRSRYGGELISARLEDGPRPTYVLRWRLPDGQVRDFRVPADR